MAGPYGKLKADKLIWWDPTDDGTGTNTPIGDVEHTLEDIADKATLANPEFTGNVKLTAQGELRLADSGSSNHVGFKSPTAVQNDVVWTLPAADGTVDGQMLTTNAAGILSWSTTDLSNYALKTGTTFTGTVVTPNHVDVDAAITDRALLTGDTFTGDVKVESAVVGGIVTSKKLIFDDGANDDYNPGGFEVSYKGGGNLSTYGSDNINFETDTGNILFQSDMSGSGADMAAFNAGGSCILYHDGTPRLSTTNVAVDVTGILTVSEGANFGATSALQITIPSDGASGYDTNFTNNSSGVFHLRGEELVIQDSGNGNTEWIHCVDGAGVQLSHAGNQRLETTDPGVDVSGDLGVSGDITAVDLTLSGDITAVDLTLSGNLTVAGNTTEINSTTLTVDDKNIELATVADIASQSSTTDLVITGGNERIVTVADTTGYQQGATVTKTGGGSGEFNGNNPVNIVTVDSATQFTVDADHTAIGAITFDVDNTTDLTADGGGITLKGTTDKTILWENDTDSWDFNQNIKVTGNIEATGTVTDSKGDVRKIPAGQFGTVTLADTDAGKFVAASGAVGLGTAVGGGSLFEIGDAVTIFCNHTADITLTFTGITCYLAGEDANKASLTLATRGIATLLCIASNTYVISGAGLS